MPRRDDNQDMASQQTEQRLLALLEGLVQEVQPDRHDTRPITLASRLDRDLGLDSLARSELLLRIEQAFGKRLPESALLAETPGDLLQQLKSDTAQPPHPEPPTTSAGPTRPAAPAGSEGKVTGEPGEADTLNAAMDWHLERHPDLPHLYLYGDRDDPETLSYGELDRGARRVAAALVSRGVRAGDRIALMLPTSRDYFIAFFGVLRAGAVPVPIYPPARPAQLEEHLRRHGRILNNAGARLLITVAEARSVAHLLHAEAPHCHIATLAELDEAPEAQAPAVPAANDLALLQYTSGSTGDPKGVQLTHAQLLANIRAMGQRLQARPDDVFVSWLPLYHDMGLIAAWLASLYYGIPLVVMSPLSFLSRPLRWLELIDRHRGTISGAPNFGYELCLRALTPERMQGLDLSSWRVAFNGAEPVSADTMEQFGKRLAPCGLQSSALMPVYGLAEAAVGLCVASPGRGVVIDTVNRERFEASGEAWPESNPAAAQRFVNCGPPLPGYRLRIVDAQGHELDERLEGDIEFQGPSATDGYFDNPEESAKLRHDGWLRTGDRGYLASGDLHISGRLKDVVVRGGRNLYPYDIEAAVGDLEGIRKGCVAVFGNPDPATGAEALVVVAETQEQDPARRRELHHAVADSVVDIVNVPADEIVLAPPHSVLKTSSGKIRRAATREHYRQGRLGKQAAPVWRQVVRLSLRARLQRWKMHLGKARYAIYYAYGWTIFGLGAALFALIGLPLPRLSWRWRVARHLSRGMAALAGIRLEIRGLEQLPGNQPFVLVANHASYLDVLILTASLPCALRYLAKEELESRSASRIPLTRMGALFVERFDPRQAEQDMQQAEHAVAAGDSLAIFPEGTFGPKPGLGDFHMGAFLTAAHAGVPVVPVAIEGTRERLRGREWRPHPGRVTLHVGAPLQPKGSDWNAALQLKNEAYAFILENCGESRHSG
ncbi:AMP-binding protein [Billgrantia kenyensis]|uniref:AMP-binding protein n=1 Tax=Billgrantia kenyensis TaxID=321266 RepID=A0A7V9W1Z4_9GAMM|nr:AMP-binding protein [Halomonas kenyensis]MBA2779555.1 AMP-binding protein [Halomonas kenyensis]MCG6662267.1 AMP-binding protein [Halomonas kenyensis]